MGHADVRFEIQDAIMDWMWRERWEPVWVQVLQITQDLAWPRVRVRVLNRQKLFGLEEVLQ